MLGRVDLNLFLCKEEHLQHYFRVGEGGDEEVGWFFRGPALRGNADLGADLIFDEYTCGVERLPDTNWGMDWKAWKIRVAHNSGRDSVN